MRDIIVHFNVNLELLTKLVNSAFCWWANWVDFKTHRATIKIKEEQLIFFVITGPIKCLCSWEKELLVPQKEEIKL